MREKMTEYTPPEESTYVLYSHYDDIEDYPFYDASGTLAIILITYLVFVLYLGPSIMKNREGYKLKSILSIYNIFQVILSIYLTYLGIEIFLETGVLPKACPIFDPKFREKISYYMYAYCLAKITELLDTIFFVLRKKYNQVSFLHLYHHTSVIIGAYILFRYSHSLTCIYFMTINCTIHVIMYFYYFVSGLGPEYAKYLSWKRHLTNLQRIQFIAVFLHQLYSLSRTKCEYTAITIVYVVYSTTLFFIMFTNFYTSTYKKPKRKNKHMLETSGENARSQETKDL